MAYKIDHDRPNCIGCGACAAVAPEFWEMSPDGKSSVKGATKKEENGEVVREELDIKDEDFEKNKTAADSCPVNVIHILKDGQKII